MRVALVHDYLTQHGGAERVLHALHDRWPDAPVFTSVVAPDALPADWATWDLRESPLGRLPGAARWHRAALPLYPALFRGLGPALRPYDVVLSDSSAWAHQAPAAPGAAHVCYCHSPARFLWGDRTYLGPARIPLALRPAAAAAFAALRRSDRRAAARVTRYLANSRAVAARLRAAYGVEATVVYPPVELERFADPPGGTVPPEPWYLVVSRLVPHKRVDLAVEAFTWAGLPLKVVGDGRSLETLRRVAGPTVEFLGRLDDAATADHLRRCRALVLPATEDFGITAVEAQAAGRPVVAFGAGGALETVIPGETGVLFGEPTASSLLAAIDACEALTWRPERARANAARFGRDRFQDEVAAVVEATLAARRRQTTVSIASPRSR